MAWYDQARKKVGGSSLWYWVRSPWVKGWQ